MDKNIFDNITYSLLSDKDKTKIAKNINDKIVKLYKKNGEKRIKVNEEFLREFINSQFFIFFCEKFQECLRLIDFEGFSFKGISVEGKDFSYTNVEIDPQIVARKSLYYTNLEGVDLSDKNFEGVFIEGANLEGTKANIDPQLISYKSLYYTKLKGIKLRRKSFENVDVRNSDLRNTGAKIIISDLKTESKKHPLYKTKITNCKVYSGNANSLLDNLYIASCYLRNNEINPNKEKTRKLSREITRSIPKK